jgi:hypothetical protein
VTGPEASAAPPSYRSRMLAELDLLEQDYADVLRRSTILNIDPNRHGGGGGVAFVGFPIYGWGPSDPALEAERMDLLRRLRDWAPRYRLLFPHPVRTVTARLDSGLRRLEDWLLREGRDHSVPATNEHAVIALAKCVKDLRGLSELLPTDKYAIRLAPDTNTLIDNPDLAAHTAALGPRYMAHVLPVVFGELDDLKRSGRTQDLRDAAKKADRRLKALRDNGDVRVGAKVAGDVVAVFEHAEPRDDGLPTWLDLSVPDDRFIAAVLQLQSQHPGSALFVATGDLNMQNKLSTVGLPFVELP